MATSPELIHPNRDPRFDVLFEPVQIGPVTAPNRFYQVPHCTGMGAGMPQTLAAMREVKAEGGWGVVNTEYCSIHPTSDDLPFPHCTLWDEDDVRSMALMADKVHAHGALAGVELWHGGMRSSNLNTRLAPLAPVSLPVSNDPLQAQAMDGQDIKDLRRWQREAAVRARRAGFDIVYVYATHTYLLSQFLDPATNTRSDEYGGSSENRARLVRELLEETAEALAGESAVSLRISVDDENSEPGERDALLAALAPYCDLFNVTVSKYRHEMGVSRFIESASLEDKVSHVRELTGKPVVSVGRFTSPETMLSQVRRGVLDLVGAARPSIADPFLPAKIRDGRLDEIRECIGCNVCYAGDGKSVPIRCTQNPTMGEEWRRGWHPERVPQVTTDETVLVVGAGPAGLEAASTLVKRGYSVLVAEAGAELGGRVTRESKLPGLSEWIRVRDYRAHVLTQHYLASVHLNSYLTADDIRSTGCEHVLLATGSAWRRDGRGRTDSNAIHGIDDANVLTPDDIMDGNCPAGRYLIYDDDGYYMASVLAVLLARAGNPVAYVTPDSVVSSWSSYTAEQYQVQTQLIDHEVEIVTGHYLASLQSGSAELRCVYSDRACSRAFDQLVPVTSREPTDGLWNELREHAGDFQTLLRIGDCRAPGIIATAVYDGHKAARELGTPVEQRAVRREIARVS